jgi:hypothetical protein
VPLAGHLHLRAQGTGRPDLKQGHRASLGIRRNEHCHREA